MDQQHSLVVGEVELFDQRRQPPEIGCRECNLPSWSIKGEVMEQMADIRQWDGKFVVPIPRVEVLA